MPGAFREEERPWLPPFLEAAITASRLPQLWRQAALRLEHSMAPGAGVRSSTPCCLGGCWPSKQKKGCEKAAAEASVTT